MALEIEDETQSVEFKSRSPQSIFEILMKSLPEDLGEKTAAENYVVGTGCAYGDPLAAELLGDSSPFFCAASQIDRIYSQPELLSAWVLDGGEMVEGVTDAIHCWSEDVERRFGDTKGQRQAFLSRLQRLQSVWLVYEVLMYLRDFKDKNERFDAVQRANYLFGGKVAGSTLAEVSSWARKTLADGLATIAETVATQSTAEVNGGRFGRLKKIGGADDDCIDMGRDSAAFDEPPQPDPFNSVLVKDWMQRNKRVECALDDERPIVRALFLLCMGHKHKVSKNVPETDCEAEDGRGQDWRAGERRVANMLHQVDETGAPEVLRHGVRWHDAGASAIIWRLARAFQLDAELTPHFQATARRVYA